MAIDFQSTINYDNLQRAYVITMFAMWGIGVDIPRLLARYARSYPMVINIHSISMLIIGLMTLMYTTALTVTYFTQMYPAGKVLAQESLAAFVLAWVLCGCVLLQFGIGFKLRYEMVTNRLSVQMFSSKRVHRIVGTGMSILGKIVVALQLYSYTKTSETVLFKGWLFMIGTLLLIFVMFEIVYRIQTRSVMFKFPLKHKSKFEKHHMQILDNLNSNRDTFPDYKELGVRYIILDNVMYYIDQNFIHPGGQHIFSLYNGQEVNYLFRGTHQPSPSFPRHNHTKYAFNYLEQREVGRINVQSILLNRNQSSEQIVQWKLTALQQMEADSFLVEFQAGDAYVRQMLSVENFGKYMMIGCPGEEIIGKERRPYSLIISLGNLQQSISKRFKQAYFNSWHQGSSGSLLRKKGEQSSFDTNQRRSALTFCIKKYKHGLFTKFMFSSQTERKFKIEGPYGRGLRLKPASKGYFIIIAAGTGVTPFVDLFHFLFLKTLLKLIKKKQGDKAAQRLNLQGVDYSMLDDVRIVFIGSFASSKHFYQSNVVKDLYHLNRKHELNEFNMQLRYNNGETEPDVTMIRQFFDKKFIQSLLKQQPDRIYYCGPPAIEEVIRKVEEQKNIKNKFFFV